MIPASVLVLVATILFVAMGAVAFALVLLLRKTVKDLAHVVDRHVGDDSRHLRPADPKRAATPGLN